MQDLLLSNIVPQGIFALLFLYLLFYVLKENGKREAKYQEIISNLTDTLKQDVTCLAKDVSEIKDKIFK